MISRMRSGRVGDQSHQLPRIPLLEQVGTLSSVHGNKLGWLVGKGILGERHGFELKLIVEMDAIPSRRAERHNVRTLYWGRGGVRPLTIADNINIMRTCLVSLEYGRKKIEGVGQKLLTLKVHLCGNRVLDFTSLERNRGLASQTVRQYIPQVALKHAPAIP